jgi:ubiquitin related modifier 1
MPADSHSYSGGLEILFSNERKHHITLPTQVDDGGRPTIAYLLRYLVDNIMKDQRKELFIMEDNVYVANGAPMNQWQD